MNTSKLSIICFHGSPGIPEEFNDLIKLLPQYRFITFSRKGYPKRNNQPESFSENSTLTHDAILLGYSWGNVPALQYAFKNLAHVKGIIIVSPYLYPSQKSSIKLIVSVPLLRNVLLKFFGQKIINTMLHKSSSPMKAPLAYKRLVKILSQPQVLYTAITEKQPLDSEVLKKIAQANIPIALVFGEKDLTSKQNEQVIPIKRILKPLVEVQIEKAGHALPFTSSRELAKIVNDFIIKVRKAKE